MVSESPSGRKVLCAVAVLRKKKTLFKATVRDSDVQSAGENMSSARKEVHVHKMSRVPSHPDKLSNLSSITSSALSAQL